MKLLANRLALVLAIAAIMAPPPAYAKPKGCFSAGEENAEQMVRQGLRLREGARSCDASPWAGNMQPIWQQIDQQLGPQFAQQTQVRQRAFDREFSQDAENKLSEWNGRIVFYFRNYPLSDVYCSTVKKMLTDVQKGGWPAFTRQAAKGGGVVRMNYKQCG